MSVREPSCLPSTHRTRRRMPMGGGGSSSLRSSPRFLQLNHPATAWHPFFENSSRTTRQPEFLPPTSRKPRERKPRDEREEAPLALRTQVEPLHARRAGRGTPRHQEGREL